MTPSAFSTGDWQDQQKKQQPAATPATSPQSAPAPGVGAPPQAPATPPQPAQTWGQHNSQQQMRQRNYYGQQPQPGQPQQMPAQTAASYGMPTAAPSQPTRTEDPAMVSRPTGVEAPSGFGSALGQAFTQQSLPSGPGGSSFMESAQVDPLPPEQPGDVLKAQPTSGMAPRQRPQRSYYGG